MTETKATPAKLLSAHILNIWQEQDPENSKLISKLAEEIGYCPIKLMEEILENHNHDNGYLQDVIYGFCSDGGETTNIEQYNNVFHEEIRAIKIQGKWVGWSHLSGGGKYNFPEEYAYIGHSFFLDLVSEEEVTITKRTFAYKKDE